MDKSLILNAIKLHYGFKSNAEFARFLEITPQILSNWRARNSIDYDLIYTKCVDIDANWLLTGEGPMLKNKRYDEIEVNTNNLNKQPSIITVDSFNRDNIVLVPQTLKAGYLKGYNDVSFIETLPSYRMPGLNNGVFRMFEIEGNSMYPTLPNKSYVVGEFVENWITGIKEIGRAHV